MSKNRLEIKITKDANDKPIDISTMSLVEARKFSSLIESITKIIQLTPNNDDITIEISSGSACVAAEGVQVESINNDFKDILENKSSNKELIQPWRDIQEVVSANGLQYEANFIINGNKVSFSEKLLDKKFRSKPVLNKNPRTTIKFIQGKLIAVGGKNPNIHVDIGAKTESALLNNDPINSERITISCTEISANKAKAFLYNNIFLSAWVNEDKNYQLCDSYAKQDVFDNYRMFIEDFNRTEQIESLKKLHYRCRDFLDKKDYGNFRRFLRLFKHESTDINILKTILIITQSFKENENISKVRLDIKELFDEKLYKIRKNKSRK